MKRILVMFCAFAAMLAGTVSCEEPETGYEGINYIYLDASSDSMYDTEDASIKVTATLTTAIDQNLTLMFEVNDPDGIITLEGNPVTIAAGETTAAFTVTTKEIPDISASFRITLSDDTVLPENVQWDEDFLFTVKTSAVSDLTEDQIAIIESYRETTGIDLSKYLGLVKVSTVYTEPTEDGDGTLPARTLEGITAITLSEESTAEQPVLKMTDNPMGIQSEMFAKLKKSTVENIYWTDEYAYENYPLLMETVPWTDSETFSMTLDGIAPKADGTVEFVADLSYYDEVYEEDVKLFKVPFEFSFSLYDKEVKAAEEGLIGTAVDEYWFEDATYNPDFQLNCIDITEETAEEEFSALNWTASSATISNESMVFTFCLMNYIDYDYTKIVATYTPDK